MLPAMAMEYIVSPILFRQVAKEGWISTRQRRRGQNLYCEGHEYAYTRTARYVTHVWVVMGIRCISPRICAAVRHDAFWGGPLKEMITFMKRDGFEVPPCQCYVLGCWTRSWLLTILRMELNRSELVYLSFMRELLPEAEEIVKRQRKGCKRDVLDYAEGSLDQLEAAAVSYRESLDDIVIKGGGKAHRKRYHFPKGRVNTLPPEDWLLVKMMWSKTHSIIDDIQKVQRYRGGKVALSLSKRDLEAHPHPHH